MRSPAPCGGTGIDKVQGDKGRELGREGVLDWHEECWPGHNRGSQTDAIAKASALEEGLLLSIFQALQPYHSIKLIHILYLTWMETAHPVNGAEEGNEDCSVSQLDWLDDGQEVFRCLVIYEHGVVQGITGWRMFV